MNTTTIVGTQLDFMVIIGYFVLIFSFGFFFAKFTLTAALMSTIDTLINAVSAVAVNDVYKPYMVKGASDGHYLRVARIVSLSAAIFGLILVPVFASFRSIYVAHGAFTASITPPMVVTIVLASLLETIYSQGCVLDSIGWFDFGRPVPHLAPSNRSLFSWCGPGRGFQIHESLVRTCREFDHRD